ncbi:hypothetical protein WM015_01910 [Bifidobacterium mongoliense]|jgi:tetratricopeptide (TPR) repeat protein|nr:hypothetical protein [Bifidobacterium mongoliense]
MNVIERHVNTLIGALEGKRISPAFFERSLILKASVSSIFNRQDVFSLRSVGAPYYVTDLGVRFSEDPHRFYLLHCDIAGLRPIEESEIVHALSESDIASFGNKVDAFIVFFGDYRCVSKAIAERKSELIAQGSYSTLVYCGVVLAALGNGRSADFFESAVQKTDNPHLKYAAVHRMAAAEIKRFHRSNDAIKLLTQAKDSYIDKDDPLGQIDLALYYNLYALAEIGSRTDLGIVSILEMASHSLTSGLESGRLGPMSKSMAARYASQVAINKAQILAKEGDYSAAKNILYDNLQFCILNVPEYYPEAAAEHAYTCFLDRDYDSALLWSEKAFARYYFSGDLRGMQTCREIAAASLNESGHVASGDAVAALIHEDPLGCDDFGGQ